MRVSSIHVFKSRPIFIFQYDCRSTIHPRSKQAPRRSRSARILPWELSRLNRRMLLPLYSPRVSSWRLHLEYRWMRLGRCGIWLGRYVIIILVWRWVRISYTIVSGPLHSLFQLSTFLQPYPPLSEFSANGMPNPYDISFSRHPPS